MDGHKFTPKQEAFIDAVVKGASLTDAYRSAYNVVKALPSTVNTKASQLMAMDHISERIRELRVKSSKELVADARFVVEQWMMLATADPRELINHRRICCRHCWGDDHRYQWRDEDEWSEELARVLDFNSKSKEQQPMPDDAGGYGFRFNRAPHPECPRCLGEGKQDVFVSDFNNLSPKAALLYNGIKVTRDGLEVKFRDRDAAVANIAKWLGMHRPDANITVIHQGQQGNVAETVPTDPEEASRFYREFMGRT